MYPGSKCEIKTDGSAGKHLIVIKGVAKSTINNQIRFFKAGQSLVLPENQVLILENTADESLIVIGVKANSICADI
jgi:mannose-6-phosphate isomerase-like protein (cupin superfamily)